GEHEVAVAPEGRAGERRGGRRHQPLKALALEAELRLAQAVFGEHERVRIHEQHALHAVHDQELPFADRLVGMVQADDGGDAEARSEEHTSELQSRENLVCRLLLEKKKKQTSTE